MSRGKGRRSGQSLALVPLAALLGACATDPAELATPSPDPAAEAAPPEIAARPPEPEIDHDPQNLIGMGPVGLFALLGKPELIRRESPARIWQYRTGDCVFDVVLYELDEGELVTYVEARDNRGNRTEPRPCLNALLRAQQDKTAG